LAESAADLAALNFAGVDLRDVDLRGADLAFANLKEAEVDGTTRLDRKWYRVWMLHNARYACLDLKRADLKNADLTGGA